MATRIEYSSRPRRESLSKRLGRTALRIQARDAHICVYCGEQGTSLDHLTPRSRGGLDVAANLVSCCRSCNSARQATPLHVWCAALGLSSREIRRQARRALPSLDVIATVSL